MTTQPQVRRRSLWRGLLVAVLALLLVAVAGMLVWANTPLGPSPEAIAALVSDDQVQVEQGNWLVFRPVGVTPDTGLIFYPGGRVDYRSYAPQARDIAAEGYLVVVPKMPLNLAVTAPGKATGIIAAFPEVPHWAVGGHSLGGAMAATFVHDQPDAVDGLVFWAAYPAANKSLAGSSVQVVSISGTNDGLATPAKIAASEPLVPTDTHWVPIQGGNHAQFGSYGLQPGDGTATISAEEQRAQTVAATVALLAALGQP